MRNSHHCRAQVADQRLDVAKVEAEKAALSRLDKIKADQGTRATALEAEAQESEHRAALIEYNLQAVDACIDAVNAAIATGEATAQTCSTLLVVHCVMSTGF